KLVKVSKFRNKKKHLNRKKNKIRQSYRKADYFKVKKSVVLKRSGHVSFVLKRNYHLSLCELCEKLCALCEKTKICQSKSKSGLNSKIKNLSFVFKRSGHLSFFLK